MKTLIILAAAISAACAQYAGGWDPRYCCYPVPEECCPTGPCPECLDVAIVLDISGSIGEDNFNNLYIPFVTDFLNSASWTIGGGADEYQVSLTTFASCIQEILAGPPMELVYGCDVLVNWGDAASQDAAAYEGVLGSITSTGGITNTGQALKDTREQVLMGPGNRPDCPDACIVVTDGAENVNATIFDEELEKFHMACDFVIAIGVTTSVPMSELERISGSADFAFHVDDFDGLQAILPTLEDALCNGTPRSGSSSSDGCCPYDYPAYFHLQGY